VPVAEESNVEDEEDEEGAGVDVCSREDDVVELLGTLEVVTLPPRFGANVEVRFSSIDMDEEGSSFL
jgi:hypothetical protein